MNDYVFLYRGGERPESLEVGQQVMQKWMSWMKELGDRGHLKDPGHPLEASGKVVKGGNRTVTDGPFAEAKDLVGGYTLVMAADLAQAAELAHGCPIFERGGLVEVRPILKMDR